MSVSRRKFLKLGIRYGCAGLILGYPVFIERYIVVTNIYAIPVPNLPREFDGFRITHITDVHYGSLVPKVFVEMVVDKANACKTDIIVCTGDYVHERNSTVQLDAVWPILEKLSAPAGVYSVLGNHDHWADFERSVYWLDRSGQNIRHKAVPLEKNGKRIWIGGAGDLMEDKIGIDEAFENVPEQACKICLAHNPDTADSKYKTRIDLMISGHTHGGQVNIPFVGTPKLPVENKRYSSGFIRSDKTNLFISRGIGWSIIPVRFNCYPEIAILELKSA